MPRSPSRDLSDRFIGKRGYFRWPDPLRRGKIALSWVALLSAAAWGVVDVAEPVQRVQYSHSHGRLANVHAAFDNNCEACHKAHGLDEFNPVSVFNVRDRWHDMTCEKCHGGPAHHASANDEALKFHNRCSNCHHDHNGRLGSLVRLADKDCNQCHENLGKYFVPPDPKKPRPGELYEPYQNKITNFVKDHPEFRSLGKKDEKGNFEPVNNPRTLKFSHAVHMSPGQAYTDGGGEAMTVDKLRKFGGDAAVARYAAGAAGDAKIQLACASCHALDAGAGTADFAKIKDTLAKGDPTHALLPPRAEGAYFLPVNFEVHCRSCHPAQAKEGVSKVGDAEYHVPPFDVSHRKQPADLVPELRAGYLRGLSALKHPALKRPLELGGKLELQPNDLTQRTLSQEVDRLATDAEAIMFSGGICAKCHSVVPGEGKAKPRVAVVPDRTVWFKHAKFNHASHRGATCATCHPGTGAAFVSPTEADKPEPVQIVGVKTCQACHSPPGTDVNFEVDGKKIVGGGARHACTDCHRYHNGDYSLQGRGAAARDPGRPLNLIEWLQGNTK